VTYSCHWAAMVVRWSVRWAVTSALPIGIGFEAAHLDRLPHWMMGSRRPSRILETPSKSGFRPELTVRCRV
jgi:hypothetical protein